ncbi:MAG TPA: PIG-L deacetylase family protein [Bosea sp. (in: a-proteobacteria)]|jgi:LmbE family N-acetylglucosaminyl deacetylase|uniref:PIG-L deacetylase family protein n=1 Tax=Bosea sp. (in: a-proteobacteria) TaxID=1871050 RepID=UPI002E0F12D5|nr:PIG-L deacetylase family protein [Bosea sp. (in: a-proteobacteria)]
MLRLKPDGDGRSPLQILCLGCHSDDIEIGCGGTVLQIAAERPDAVFHWVVFSAKGVRVSEAESGARQFVDPARMKRVILKDFQDGYMPFLGADIKNVFEDLKREVQPDIIFTHNRHDSHQDHRLIAELTWNTFRSHLILEYEIPKYDGDLGQPSVFNALSDDVCEKKVDLILDTFKSQSNKPWFDRSTFMALMRLRGMECNAPSGYAEAFYARKLML